jgi:hypothetical protein
MMMAPGNLRNGGAAIDKCADREKRVCMSIYDGNGQMKKRGPLHCNNGGAEIYK